MSVLAAVIWHYWLGVFIGGATVLAAVGLLVAYLVTVESKRFPKRRG